MQIQAQEAPTAARLFVWPAPRPHRKGWRRTTGSLMQEGSLAMLLEKIPSNARPANASVFIAFCKKNTCVQYM